MARQSPPVTLSHLMGGGGALTSGTIKRPISMIKMWSKKLANVKLRNFATYPVGMPPIC